ncbi:MAG: cytoplasmic protein [Clostridia bacterium]|nr:cytoplasmic protein [Clostridia bacterium]
MSAHALCTNNRDALEKNSRCGCFYCERIYDPREIKDWTDFGKTAMCGFCGIDSVIPETREYPLTPEFLKKMRDYWF